eukprot:50338-Pleurochrysis_carterae.AAC.2
MKGRSLRCPEASGGNTSARVLAKWQPVLFVDQSWPTESRESRIEGTHRTSVKVPHSDAWPRPSVHTGHGFSARSNVH